MVSNVRPEGSQNWGDNVFEGLSVGPEENGLVSTYLAAHDLAPNTRRATETTCGSSPVGSAMPIGNRSPSSGSRSGT